MAVRMHDDDRRACRKELTAGVGADLVDQAIETARGEVPVHTSMVDSHEDLLNVDIELPTPPTGSEHRETLSTVAHPALRILRGPPRLT
jgi:hypothetical protein